VREADVDQNGDDELVLGAGPNNSTLQLRRGAGFTDVLNFLPFGAFTGGVIID
jgi:hypothetical protein